MSDDDNGSPPDPAATRKRARAHLRAVERAQQEGGADADSGVQSEWKARLARAMKCLAPDPPFIPVGTIGGTVYCISYLRELRAFAPKELSRNMISSLVGTEQQWLIDHYPRKKRSRNSPPDSFAPEQVADAIMSATATMGVWKPDRHVRGVGAWRGEDDELVIHLGDTLLINGRPVPCGLRGEFVYAVCPRVPRPAHVAQDGDAAHAVLRRLAQWRFKREIDPLLLLGWVVAAMVGGALRDRPHLWLTGERGTGKSSLQRMLEWLLGDNAVLVASDATAAGVTQAQGHDSKPVILDEQESDHDNERLQSVIKVMRQATTGGAVLRGGADHKGSSFSVQACFLVAGINIPGMQPQDRSRIAVVDMLPFPRNSSPLTDTGVAQLGRQLHRRIIDQWDRLQRQVLPLYYTELGRLGWDQRGCSVYATLLACADVALHDEADTQRAARQAKQLEGAWREHKGDEAPSWRRCLDHLMASVVDPYRKGEKTPVGSLVLRASGYGAGLEPRLDDQGEMDRDPAMRTERDAQRMALHEQDAVIAADQLRAIGLRVVMREKLEASGARLTPDQQLHDRFLIVANVHPTLSEIFRGTPWATMPAMPGAWRLTLSRVPGACTVPKGVRFRGFLSRVVVVPLSAATAGLVGLEAEPDGVIDQVRASYRPDESAPPAEREPGEDG
jgi:hypothetical protein